MEPQQLWKKTTGYVMTEVIWIVYLTIIANKCFTTNEIVKEMRFQKIYFDNQPTQYVKNESILDKYIKRNDSKEDQSSAWIWRYWKSSTRSFISLWDGWVKFRKDWDINNPYCKTCLKSLKNKTLDAWKDWREKMDRFDEMNRK